MSYGETIPGGRYFVKGQWVDANGVPLTAPQAKGEDSPDAPEAKDAPTFFLPAYDDITLDELRALAKGNITGYTSKNKRQLYDALHDTTLGGDS